MATFCFLVTRDLIKERIWRSWFSGLDALGFQYSIATHCSNPADIKSDWLRATLIPDSLPTSWEFHAQAILALYEYTFNNSESQWISLHSESCVPIVSPARFIAIFEESKGRTMLSYRPIWWDPAIIPRANLTKIPAKFHVQHPEWCILAREDLIIILIIANKNRALIQHILAGPAADESLVGICLGFYDRLKDVINTQTTIVDWDRSPNGDNPYTFATWGPADDELMKIKRAKHPWAMFLRKIGSTIPDEIITNLWSDTIFSDESINGR
jgi:hypothetical protein